ncbi:response regulator [Dehalogenimonas sp. THU2]|uniref:response regulator n=1 Tax=Dehalogenimonas sp. THU2 TaxID=3151121 RepID=UPI0032188145
MPHGQKPRLLVVEDEPSIGEVCLRILTREGFAVELAVNGRIGMEMITRQDFDLFLIDIRTPSMSGKDLYKWMLENRGELAGHVMFTTGDMMSEDLLLYIKGTSRPFLPKPFTPDELIETVKKTWRDIAARLPA